MYFPINNYLHVKKAFKYCINSLKDTLLGVFDRFFKYSFIVDKISKNVASDRFPST